MTEEFSGVLLVLNIYCLESNWERLRLDLSEALRLVSVDETLQQATNPQDNSLALYWRHLVILHPDMVWLRLEMRVSERDGRVNMDQAHADLGTTMNVVAKFGAGTHRCSVSLHLLASIIPSNLQQALLSAVGLQPTHQSPVAVGSDEILLLVPWTTKEGVPQTAQSWKLSKGSNAYSNFFDREDSPLVLAEASRTKIEWPYWDVFTSSLSQDVESLSWLAKVFIGRPPQTSLIPKYRYWIIEAEQKVLHLSIIEQNLAGQFSLLQMLDTLVATKPKIRTANFPTVDRLTSTKEKAVNLQDRIATPLSAIKEKLAEAESGVKSALELHDRRTTFVLAVVGVFFGISQIVTLEFVKLLPVVGSLKGGTLAGAQVGLVVLSSILILIGLLKAGWIRRPF